MDELHIPAHCSNLSTSQSLGPLPSLHLICSPPASSVHGIFQARILEWVAFPSPGDLPDSGIEPSSLMSPALAGGSLPLAPPEKPLL